MSHPATELTDCVFCPSNGKVDILMEMNGMYVVHAKDEATFGDLADRFLIVPVEHTEEPTDLPLGWGETLVELTYGVGLDTDFNWALNKGSRAGQTRPHLHWWGLDRRTDDIGKGMSWMIQRIPELEAGERRLRQQVSDLELQVADLRRHAGLQLNGL